MRRRTPATFAASRIPQVACEGALAELMGGMFSDGGLQAAMTTNTSRFYTGGGFSPQLFLMPATPNDNMSTAAQTSGVTRNALNRRRGAGAH